MGLAVFSGSKPNNPRTVGFGTTLPSPINAIVNAGKLIGNAAVGNFDAPQTSNTPNNGKGTNQENSNTNIKYGTRYFTRRNAAYRGTRKVNYRKRRYNKRRPKYRKSSKRGRYY